MSISIILDVHMTPDAAQAARDGGYAETFKATRAFDGCESIKAYGVEGEPERFVVFERWASKEHYQRYLDWRRETGYFEQNAGRMMSPPAVRFLEEVA